MVLILLWLRPKRSSQAVCGCLPFTEVKAALVQSGFTLHDDMSCSMGILAALMDLPSEDLATSFNYRFHEVVRAEKANLAFLGKLSCSTIVNPWCQQTSIGSILKHVPVRPTSQLSLPPNPHTINNKSAVYNTNFLLARLSSEMVFGKRAVAPRSGFTARIGEVRKGDPCTLYFLHEWSVVQDRFPIMDKEFKDLPNEHVTSLFIYIHGTDAVLCVELFIVACSRTMSLHLCRTLAQFACTARKDISIYRSIRRTYSNKSPQNFATPKVFSDQKHRV